MIPATLVLLTGAAMSGYVVLRREKTDLHWLLVALLVSLMVWTGGTVVRFTVTDESALEAALRIINFGVFSAPQLWLLLAARTARIEWLGRRFVRVALFVPSVAAYGALLSNDAHGLMLKEVSFAALEAGGPAWVGPLYWIFVAWAYTCVAAGAGLYLWTAHRLVVEQDRPRGTMLAVASLAPIAGSSVYLFRLLPVSFDLTPSSLIISLLLLSVAVFRYQLLETLPLTRRDVIENLDDGVLMAGADGRLLDLNPAAAMLLAQSAESLRGRPLLEALVERCDEHDAAELRKAFAELDAGAASVQVEVRTPDDRRFEVSAAWARDASGNAAGQFALVRDRTEERRMEWLVRHTQKLRTVGTLAAGVAHEVNNPLAFIRANLAHVHRLGTLVEEAREGRVPAGKLFEELEDLTEIAAQTLDGISRIERIVMDLRRFVAPREQGFQAVDLNQVVRDALRLANMARMPEVGVATALAESLPPVAGAPERLVQAVLNLLVNARQALRDGKGWIGLETARAGDWVEVRVRDDGPGIPSELQDRIFDPFFTTKDPDQGTGLGLSISFDIVRDHGGVLEVHSAPGAGACFVARLPVR